MDTHTQNGASRTTQINTPELSYYLKDISSPKRLINHDIPQAVREHMSFNAYKCVCMSAMGSIKEGGEKADIVGGDLHEHVLSLFYMTGRKEPSPGKSQAEYMVTEKEIKMNKQNRERRKTDRGVMSRDGSVTV